jgi:thiol-disulfide isomerase/thioredoxin
MVIAGEDNEAAKNTWLTFLKDGLPKYPDSRELATELSKAYLEQVRVLGERQAWDQVEEVAKEYGELLSLAPPEGAAHKALVAGDVQIKGLIRRWESQRLQAELIGKPMIPLETAAWVNGSPMTAEDLKGKVILLDFWAVWCGPCRATFPHLTEWHEKFSKDGLVVIGLTRYYQYDWDKEAEKHVQVADLAPEKEAAALEHFATHHGLKHRLAFIPKESNLSRSYGVSGIPHVVVIDRDGVIRMIRVGSGEKNAHDIETLLEELVHGTSPAAASASD